MTLLSRFALSLTLLSTLATGAMAHSKMDATTPADGAVLAAVPPEVSLHFGKDIRLTKVTLTHGSDTPVDLDLSGMGSFTMMYSLPIPDQGAGLYTVDWRGLGMDGHALTGSFGFEVAK